MNCCGKRKKHISHIIQLPIEQLPGDFTFPKNSSTLEKPTNKGYNIAFFLGPGDVHEKNIILRTFPKAFFPEDLIKNYLGPEIVMCSTKHLACSLSNDTGTGHMLSTNLCPQLKLFCKYDPVKFTPKSRIIKIISSQEFNSKNINSIPVKEVIEKIEDLILSNQ